MLTSQKLKLGSISDTKKGQLIKTGDNENINFWIKKNEDACIQKMYTKKSIKNYTFALKSFLEYFSKDPLKIPSKITENDLAHYLFFLVNEKKYSPATFNGHLAALKFFYKEIIQNTDVSKKFIKIKEKPRASEVLSWQEMKSLLLNTKNLKEKVLLQFSYFFGLKVNQVIQLKLSDLYFDEQSMYVTGTKFERSRVEVLPNLFMHTVQEYIADYKPNTFLFEGQSEGKHICDKNANKILKKAYKPINPEKHIKFGALRHTSKAHKKFYGADFASLFLKELAEPTQFSKFM